MCGRFVNRHDRSQYRHWVDTDWDDDEQVKISFNVAPTDPIEVIRLDGDGLRHLHVARWGFISKEGRPLINARGETVATKYPFKFSFSKRRCLVPMSGYYEWKAEAGAKQPYFIHPADGAPLAAAAVFERATNPKTGEPVDTVAIITTAAGSDLRELHDRMPVFIPAEKHRLWLDSETPAEVAEQLLLPMSGLVVARASRRVNSVKNSGPDLLDPLAV